MKSIKLPKGFKANGIHAGLKKKRKDLALIFSEEKCVAAAVFTKNIVKAAPVIHGKNVLKQNKNALKAVLINSGNANCMTGVKGYRDTEKMALLAAKELKIPVNSVFVSSTGVIGKRLDIRPVENSMKELVEGLSSKGVLNAAEAIMTTDKFCKVATRGFSAGGKEVRITGIAKGAGMIKPDMATTLCYVMTDANVKSSVLKKNLKNANEMSFNSISVDGDMSTNDTVLVMANGSAGNKLLQDKSKDSKVFENKLREVLTDLAKMIVADGEGATKLVTIKVSGAKNDNDAKKACARLADSLLLKCAVHGEDPNWGRVASSMGASGIKFDPGRMDIKLDGVFFLKKGEPVKNKSDKTKKVFKNKEVIIEVFLKEGEGRAEFYACDISKKYIAINSFYTT